MMNSLSSGAKKRILLYGVAVLVALALIASALLPLESDTQGKFRNTRSGNITAPPATPVPPAGQPVFQPGQESIFQSGQDNYTQTDDFNGAQNIVMPNEIVIPNGIYR